MIFNIILKKNICKKKNVLLYVYLYFTNRYIIATIITVIPITNPTIKLGIFVLFIIPLIIDIY